MAKHPTNSRRNKRKKLKETYAKVREDAQVAGIIVTTPEGAVRPEAVNPASQGEQSLLGIDRAAVRNGWAVPEEKKPMVVDRLLEVFEMGPQKMVTRDGIEIEVPPDYNLMKENAKVLILADKTQFDRDHPEDAGKARGGGNTTTVNVVTWDALLQGLAGVRPDEVDRKVVESIEVNEQESGSGPQLDT